MAAPNGAAIFIVRRAAAGRPYPRPTAVPGRVWEAAPHKRVAHVIRSTSDFANIWGPRASPAKRVAWGTEEQRRERAFPRAGKRGIRSM